jgi:hypothetical protein
MREVLFNPILVEAIPNLYIRIITAILVLVLTIALTKWVMKLKRNLYKR